MKRLLTTAMVLVMIATMFCASPAVTAANTPEMTLKVITKDSPNSDTISATLENVSDATWVVWSIKTDSTSEYVCIEEKRGNKAEAEGFSFVVADIEKAALQTTEDFVAEAKITYSNGTVTTVSKAFEYNTFIETQAIIRDMLAETVSISDATTALTWPLPAYYSSNTEIDAGIIDSLCVTYAAEIAEPTAIIDPETFYGDLLNAMLTNTLNSHNAGAISVVIEKYYSEIGIAVNDIEKIWYDASSTKSSIASRLATFEYATVSDFTKQFKTITFLDKLATISIPEIVEFLRTYNNTYVNYGSATTLSGGTTLTNLDFASYDTLATTDTYKEYAGNYMVGSYASLDDLETKFADLLTNLTSFQSPGNENDPTPSTPSYTPPVTTGGSSSSISVGFDKPVFSTEESPFSDIDDVEWAKEAIIALAKEGVIEGVSSKQYQPNANVTREQFVKIIVNTFGLKGSGAAVDFADVDQNEWYATYVNTAYELGIIKGESETSFGVGQNISRQDMTLIMYRVANYVGIDVSAASGRTFSDTASIDDYAIDAVNALYRAGIINGVADGVFGGQQTATRAQAAKLCYDLREAK